MTVGELKILVDSLVELEGDDVEVLRDVSINDFTGYVNVRAKLARVNANQDIALVIY